MQNVAHLAHADADPNTRVERTQGTQYESLAGKPGVHAMKGNGLVRFGCKGVWVQVRIYYSYPSVHLFPSSNPVKLPTSDRLSFVQTGTEETSESHPD